jgi:hypothetical protein
MQVVAVERLIERVFPKNEHARQSITEAVSRRIAQHLEKGHSFVRATVIEPVGERQQSEHDPETPRQPQRIERKRMQARER